MLITTKHFLHNRISVYVYSLVSMDRVAALVIWVAKRKEEGKKGNSAAPQEIDLKSDIEVKWEESTLPLYLYSIL